MSMPSKESPQKACFLLLPSLNTFLVLASVLAFVTYSLTGHPLSADVIFASLTLFNLLRLPLAFLRMAVFLQSCTIYTDTLV